MSRKLVPALFIVLMFAASSFAALRPLEYSASMNDILRADGTASKREANELWNLTLKIIDNADYSGLRDKFEWFNEGNYKRNMLLHYGWEADPAKHTPLMKQTEQDIRQYAVQTKIPFHEVNNFLKTQQKDFAAYVRGRIQKRQEDELTSAVVRVLGIPSNRGYSRAMAAVVYDLHLLAEYEAAPSAHMQRLEDIERNFGDNMQRLLTQGDFNAKRAKGDAIARWLKEARRVTGNNKTKAQAMMNVVRNHLADILNEGFRKELRLKGITLK